MLQLDKPRQWRRKSHSRSFLEEHFSSFRVAGRIHFASLSVLGKIPETSLTNDKITGFICERTTGLDEEVHHCAVQKLSEADQGKSFDAGSG